MCIFNFRILVEGVVFIRDIVIRGIEGKNNVFIWWFLIFLFRSGMLFLFIFYWLEEIIRLSLKLRVLFKIFFNFVLM